MYKNIFAGGGKGGGGGSLIEGVGNISEIGALKRKARRKNIGGL